MNIWQPVKFTLLTSWRVNKKLFLLYAFIQTLLALTFIIDLLSYKEIIDSINGTKTILGLPLHGVIFLLFIYYLLSKILEGISNYTWNLLDADQTINLNKKFIDKLATLDLSIYENPQSVGLANRAFNRFQVQFKYYLKAIFEVYNFAIKLIIHLVIFFTLSPFIGLIIILANIFHILVNAKTAHGIFLIYRADDEIKRKFEYIVNTLFNKDTLAEIKIYKAFPFLRDKIIRIYRQFTNHQLQVEKKHQIFDTLSGFLPTASTFIYSLSIANKVVSGIITPGQFLFLFFNSLSFNGSLYNLGQNLGHLHADGLFMKDAMEYFDLKPNINFPKLSVSQKNELMKKLEKPVIEIENVSFQYPQGTKLVLKKINLKISYGQNVAIIGENGAGKTTLVKLLLRMYDPTEGKILINGIDIKTIPEDIIFAVYSSLFQVYGKFYFTIKENLKLAAGEDISDDEMISCLKFSNAWEFVKDFKDQLNQQLGSEFTTGTDLSVGQWQKLAIARAYAKKAPILILDEPTSAVDAKSEMEIFDRLKREMKDNTLIFISHRFSTIKDAQRIIVLSKGVIAEDGIHEDLMKKNGIYAKLYTIQAERYKRK